MLEIKDLTIKQLKGINEADYLVKNLSFNLNNNDKMAIIGEEGNGKSTLLKAIYNQELIEDYVKVDGIISKHNLIIGYCYQNLDEAWFNNTIDEFLLKENPNDEIAYEKYNQLQLVNQLLGSLNLNTQLIELALTLKQLSGGQRVKLQIIKLLLNDPDLLLLDEPTNDLDIDTLIWLENFIINCKKPIIFISHDETLLEKTANVILHLEKIHRKTIANHTFIRTDYQSYIQTRNSALAKQDQVARKERQEQKEKMERLNQIYQKVEHQQNQAVRNPSLGRTLKKKIRSLNTQKEKINNQELTKTVDVEEAINFNFNPNNILPNNKVILHYQTDYLTINNYILANDIDLLIKANQKIVIIGNNGCGKTTLFKQIYPLLIDSNINLGYMPQDYHLQLNDNQKVIDYLMEGYIKDDEYWIRGYLGNMRFTSDEMLYNIKELSGGQKAKVLLTKMIINNCNVLLLDEPTRNLSPLSNPVLRQALKDYPGTIISISHDRKFIDEVADTIYEFANNTLVKVK